MSREFLMCAPSVAALTSGANVQTAISASENGVVHLSRLIIGGTAQPALAGYNGYNLASAMQVSNILINGSTELVRGRNVPTVPASAFDAERETTVIGLGDWSFATGDTVGIQAMIEGTNLVNGVLTVAAPFSPRNKRLGYVGPLPATRQTYAGSPTTVIAAGATLAVNVTFDADGVADLDSLIIRGALDQAAAGSNSYDGLSGLSVVNITLPSGDNLLIGQGQGGITSTLWSGLRAGNFWSPGQEWVSAGSVITIVVRNDGPDQASVSAGMPFLPAKGRDNC